MKTILVSLAAAGLMLSVPAAQAQDVSSTAAGGAFSAVDTDRNGTVSWPEFELAYPDVTQEQFAAGDLDGDGSLNADEFDTLTVSTGSVPRSGSDEDADTSGQRSLLDESSE